MCYVFDDSYFYGQCAISQHYFLSDNRLIFRIISTETVTTVNRNRRNGTFKMQQSDGAVVYDQSEYGYVNRCV